MNNQPSVAERIDRAVNGLLDGQSSGAALAAAALTSSERTLVEVAARLRGAFPPPAIGPRFEARLGARLAGVEPGRDPIGWALRHPGRLIVTGAVGSAVGVGVGVTAYAVWRSAHRSPRPAYRLLHR